MKSELSPIMNNNKYHSHEDSETDSDHPNGNRIIQIKDLSWHLSTVSLLLLLLLILFGLYQSVFTNLF